MEKTKVDINILGQDISVMCTENEKEIKLNSKEDIETNQEEDDVVDDSIESIPFISEPVKKKRTRSTK